MAYTYKRRENTSSKHSAGFPGGSPFTKGPSGGNCTWWAWGRFKEVYKLATGKSLDWTAGAGNACMFYTIMGKAGYKTGKTPKPGAIICWGYNRKPHGQPGHVAFVEQVYSNGDIEISQSGYSSGPLPNRRITKKSGYAFSGSSYTNGFIYNKVEFTNPNGTVVNVSGGATAGEHPQSWYISKYGTGAEVYFELKKYGYSHKACCAVLGNMEQESGIRLYTNGSFDGNGSEGLCQWTFGRKTKMQSYAKEHSKSKNWKSVDGQVAYFIWELNNTEKAGNKVLKNTSLSLRQMTIDFEKAFERASLKYVNFDARVKYAEKWDKRMSGSGDPGEEGFYGEEGTYGYTVNMQKRSEQLYSSDNYGWLYEKEKEETEEQKRIREERERLKNFYSNIKATNFTDYVDYNIKGQSMSGSTKVREVRTANSTLDVSHAMIETPFVEIDFAGTTIGTYKNDVDDYPNHISKLEVEKVNGEINKYTFDLVHQIRPGEDPNLVDKILSKVKYSTIKIRYGDFNSNVIYSDEKAVITNVSMNRDYASSRISYTIYATSAGEFITSHKLNFPARTEKPSTVINELLYSNPQTSSLLLDTFPGMKNTTLVSSNNLIPSNDAVLRIEEKTNISTLDYVNFLVGCMSNIANGVNDVIRGSTYYISYENDFFDQLGGAFFKISEVVKDLSGENFNHIFEVTVGFPDNNYVMGFNVDNNIAWSILYENMTISDEYIYRIDDRGQKQKQYSPNLMSSSSQLNEIQKNWWTQMVNYPISATLTLKGLMKPTMLMNYVKVNVVFYGQKHITSGTYTITGQKDILSGDGFRTVLSLTRVGE